jgi:hypothetical protein
MDMIVILFSVTLCATGIAIVTLIFLLWFLLISKKEVPK